MIDRWDPQMPSIHMSQSQSMSMGGGLGGALGGLGAAFPALHSAPPFAGAPPDFNLDFLDNMPSTDASSITAQELLNSLDNSFLNDIL